MNLTWFFWLLVLGGSWLVLVTEVGVQWSLYDQYRYGWAVPLLCVYLLGRRLTRGQVSATAVGCSALFSPTPRSKMRLSSSCHLAVAMLLCGLLPLYGVTRWLHEANPIWRLSTLLWSVEIIALSLWSLYWLQGWQAVQRFWPPITFFLLAVPWPSSLEHLVIQAFTRLNTAVSAEVLGLAGVPVLQHGNAIETTSGAIGIDDACSGIRSLQASLMVSVFLGEFYWLTVARRSLCVLAACMLSIVCNWVRTILLAGIVATSGLVALSVWHDRLGVAVIVVSFVALWIVARCAAPRRTAIGTQPSFERGSFAAHFRHLCRDIRNPPFGRCASRGLLLTLGMWLVLVEVGSRGWYWFHDQELPRPPHDWSVNRASSITGFHEVGVAPEIQRQLQPDLAFEARWPSTGGPSGQVYYFRWEPAGCVTKRAWIQLARAHEPEVCLAGLGLRLRSRDGLIQVRAGSFPIAFLHETFCDSERTVHVFFGLYDDVTGPNQLASQRNDFRSRCFAAVSGHRNSGIRLLEIALFDAESPEKAVDAIQTLVPQLLVETAPENPEIADAQSRPK
ncbi:MAG TPA: exosortase/archaeosortase family protein [Verrucomicrobiae bacterium]|nr:exosortase/archaeosortase family protein [Verrucomicrobiae bacterium]